MSTRRPRHVTHRRGQMDERRVESPLAVLLPWCLSWLVLLAIHEIGIADCVTGAHHMVFLIFDQGSILWVVWSGPMSSRGLTGDSANKPFRRVSRSSPFVVGWSRHLVYFCFILFGCSPTAFSLTGGARSASVNISEHLTSELTIIQLVS